MSRWRGGVKLLGFAALTVPLMPLQQVFRWASPTLARNFPHHYHRVLARWLGFRITIRGDIPKGPVLLAANHVSWIDIVALSAAMPLSFIAKNDVGGWPLFGQLARLQGSVFVDRNRRLKTAETRSEVEDRLAAGDALVLFPEGTSNDGAKVLSFRSSFFAVAEKGDVPVVPVTMAYHTVNGLPMTRRQRPYFAWYGDMDLPPHLWQAVQQGPIGITICFHAALPQADRKTLAKQAETLIGSHLAERLHGRGKIG
jgi:1-acyl-sn-glycerol-3-phosphate acyltransferase